MARRILRKARLGKARLGLDARSVRTIDVARARGTGALPPENLPLSPCSRAAVDARA
jgi:hypothetical protein